MRYVKWTPEQSMHAKFQLALYIIVEHVIMDANPHPSGEALGVFLNLAAGILLLYSQKKMSDAGPQVYNPAGFGK